MSKKPLVLVVMDGVGVTEKDNGNAVMHAYTPNLDVLMKECPNTTIKAHGVAVGLPSDADMGNSEVGHLNLGAGRVVYQDLVKINIACREHRLLENAEIKAAFDYVAKTGKQLHLMGLASMGGVHSSLSHVYEFLAVA